MDIHFQDFANKRPYKSFQVLQKLYNLAASQEGNYKEFYNKIARKPIFTGTVTGFDFVRNIMKKFQSYSPEQLIYAGADYETIKEKISLSLQQNRDTPKIELCTVMQTNSMHVVDTVLRLAQDPILVDYAHSHFQ